MCPDDSHETKSSSRPMGEHVWHVYKVGVGLGAATFGAISAVYFLGETIQATFESAYATAMPLENEVLDYRAKISALGALASASVTAAGITLAASR